MSVNPIDDIKLEAIRLVETQRDHQARQVNQEGQQHYHDKLEKDSDKEKTKVQDPESTEGDGIDPEGHNRGAKDQNSGKKKKDEENQRTLVQSKDPNRGRIIDITT